MEELFNTSEGFRPIAVRCAPRSGAGPEPWLLMRIVV